MTKFISIVDRKTKYVIANVKITGLSGNLVHMSELIKRENCRYSFVKDGKYLWRVNFKTR